MKITLSENAKDILDLAGALAYLVGMYFIAATMMEAAVATTGGEAIALFCLTIFVVGGSGVSFYRYFQAYLTLKEQAADERREFGNQ